MLDLITVPKKLKPIKDSRSIFVLDIILNLLLRDIHGISIEFNASHFKYDTQNHPHALTTFYVPLEWFVVLGRGVP